MSHHNFIPQYFSEEKNCGTKVCLTAIIGENFPLKVLNFIKKDSPRRLFRFPMSSCCGDDVDNNEFNIDAVDDKSFFLIQHQHLSAF